MADQSPLDSLFAGRGRGGGAPDAEGRQPARAAVAFRRPRPAPRRGEPGLGRRLHQRRVPADQRPRGGPGRRGTASFADGTSAPFTVVGADPLSDLAVVRAGGPVPPPVELGEADQLVVGQLVVAVGQPARAGRLGHRGRGQRAGTVTADPQRFGSPADRGRHPDGCGAQPGEFGRRAGGQPSAAWSGSTPPWPGSGWGWPCPSTRRRRRIISALMTDGRVRRAYLGLVTVPAPLSAQLRVRFGRAERAPGRRGGPGRPGGQGRAAGRGPASRRQLISR